MNKQRLVRFVEHVGELRRELAAGIPDKPELTVELPTVELCAISYALTQTWLSEYVTKAEGYREIMAALGEASRSIMVADSRVSLDRMINEVLGGTDAAA